MGFGMLMLSLAVMVIVIYALTFLQLKKLRHILRQGNKRYADREKRLLIMSLLVCFMQLLCTGYVVAKALFVFDKDTNLYNLIK